MTTQTISREMTDNANAEKASYCVLPAKASGCILPASASYCVLPAKASYCVLPARASYCVLPQDSKQMRPRIDLTLEDPFKVLAAVA